MKKEVMKELLKAGTLSITPLDEQNFKEASYMLTASADCALYNQETGEIEPVDKAIDGIVSLQPGEFILIKSVEHVRLPANILGILSTRGSIARCGIDCLLSDTVVEPLSDSRLWFNVKNQSAEVQKIKVGEPIVKIRFQAI